MRLIHAKTLELVDFALRKVPPYAILSHTWGEEELTFQDMSSLGGIATQKRGYRKVQETCRLALEHRLEYAWVDTCCIDKRSSAELTESINSMYRWYKDARICFVQLEDLDSGDGERSLDDLSKRLPECRWFTRGWTLQELLAPKIVEFYDSAWKLSGMKKGLGYLLSDITRVPLWVLFDSENIRSQSVAEKMSWAALRSTTRPEDRAYCLLGIFDVNMSLIYGEGEKAFRRLQEEIVKNSNDLTIFAWNNVPEPDRIDMLSVFAPSPASFSASKGYEQDWDHGTGFSVSNRGLVVAGGIGSPELGQVRVLDAKISVEDERERCYFLRLGKRRKDPLQPPTMSSIGGIALRKIGPSLFCRDRRFPLLGFEDVPFRVDRLENHLQDYRILVHQPPGGYHLLVGILRNYRDGCIHVPLDRTEFQLTDAAPSRLWDAGHQMFLSTSLLGLGDGTRRPGVVMSYRLNHRKQSFDVHAVCCWNKTGVLARLVPQDIAVRIKFHSVQNSNGFVLWDHLHLLIPEIVNFDNSVVLTVDGQPHRLTVRFVRQWKTFECWLNLRAWEPSFRMKSIQSTTTA